MTVFGTPAEEGGGGKVYMLERGAFDGVHAAMMVHPGPADAAEARPFAVTHMLVRYRGTDHARGRLPGAGHQRRRRVHRRAGGHRAAAPAAAAQYAGARHRDPRRATPPTRSRTAPKAAGTFALRPSTSWPGSNPGCARCFEAGALATGCELEIEAEAPPYAEFRNDPDLLPLYRANAERLGRQFLATGPDGPDGAAGEDAASAGRMNRASTDMGNVSLVVPSIHPYIGIGSLPAVNHQKEFAAHCVTRVADQALIDGAIGLAWTAADAARDEAIRGRLLAADS